MYGLIGVVGFIGKGGKFGNKVRLDDGKRGDGKYGFWGGKKGSGVDTCCIGISGGCKGCEIGNIGNGDKMLGATKQLIWRAGIFWKPNIQTKFELHIPLTMAGIGELIKKKRPSATIDAIFKVLCQW